MALIDAKHKNVPSFLISSSPTSSSFSYAAIYPFISHGGSRRTLSKETNYLQCTKICQNKLSEFAPFCILCNALAFIRSETWNENLFIHEQLKSKQGNLLNCLLKKIWNMIRDENILAVVLKLCLHQFEELASDMKWILLFSVQKRCSRSIEQYFLTYHCV